MKCGPFFKTVKAQLFPAIELYLQLHFNFHPSNYLTDVH